MRVSPRWLVAQLGKDSRSPGFQASALATGPQCSTQHTRPFGRSGGTSDTMGWLDDSLLMVAGRFPPPLLDMSKVQL